MDQTTSFKFLGGDVAGLYGVNQVPTNFLVGPEGEVVGVNVPLNDVNDLISSQSQVTTL